MHFPLFFIHAISTLIGPNSINYSNYVFLYFFSKFNLHEKQNKKSNIRYPSYSQLIGINHSYHSPRSSPPHVKRDIPPRLPSKKQRSQSLTPIQPGQTMTVSSTIRNLNGKYCSADGVVLGKTMNYLYQHLNNSRKLL